MTTGIDLILTDHQRVNDLFDAFEVAHDPDLVGRIVEMLTGHDQAEHAALYPLAQAVLQLGDRAFGVHQGLTKR